MQTPSDRVANPPAPRKLPFLSKVGFGVGQAGEGLHTAGLNGFLILYYQQVLGLRADIAGIALLIAMIFDAAADPITGAISDRLRSRWGRRHPLMALAVLPLGASFIALFSPPAGLGQTGLFVWLTTFAVFERVSMSLYQIPHLALGAEMASDYNDRSTLFSFSSFFGWIAAIAAGFLALTFFFPETPQYRPGTLNPNAYTPFAIAFGVAMSTAILICVVGTKREIPHLPVPRVRPAPLRPCPFLAEMLLVGRNRSFIMVFCGMLAGTLIININEILTPYMGLHFWELGTGRLRFLGLATAAGVPIALTVASLLPRRLDKRNTILVCLFTYVILANVPICLRLLGVSFFPANGESILLPILLFFAFTTGCTAPTILILLNSIFADICDEIELESGRRLEGLVFSFRSFILQCTSGVGNLVGGVLLQWIAFPTGAVAGSVPSDVLFKLGLIVGPIGGCCSLLGALFYLGYKLDRQRHAEIADTLKSRRAGLPEASTPAPAAAGIAAAVAP